MRGVDIGQTPGDFLFFGEPLSANRSSAGSSGSSTGKLSCRAGGCKARLPLMSWRGDGCSQQNAHPEGSVRGGHCGSLSSGGQGREVARAGFTLLPAVFLPSHVLLATSLPSSWKLDVPSGDGASKSRRQSHRGALLHCRPLPGR